MGDFNADLGPLGGPKSSTQLNEQGKILHRYLSSWNFVSTHLHIQQSALSYTYTSDAHSTQSTLDHIICPRGLLSKFLSASSIIEEPLNMSDHNPVVATLQCPRPLSTLSTSSNERHPLPRNWEGTTKEYVSQLYTEPLWYLLESFRNDMPP